MEEQSPDVVKWPWGTIIQRLSWVQESNDGRSQVWLTQRIFRGRKKKNMTFCWRKNSRRGQARYIWSSCAEANEIYRIFSMVRMWAIDSNPNPDETNEKWSKFSAKVRKLWQWPTPARQNRWFLRVGTLVVLLSKHKSGHVARISIHCRSCRAEPARYAY